MRSVIFFDLGNTLVSGMEPSFRRELGGRLGLSEKEVKRAGRLLMTAPAIDPGTLAAALSTVLPRVEPERLRRAVTDTWRIQEESVRERDGATRLIETLKERGYIIGVISNACHATRSGLLRCCPHLADKFDHVFYSYLEGIKKPSPALFEKAVRASGVPAGRCWMVGDTWELDVAPASSAGMKTVWLLTEPRRERDIVDGVLGGKIPPPNRLANSLDEIRAFFLEQGV